MLRLLTAFLLLLVIVANADHETSFCTLTPDTGTSLPPVPEKFRLYMKSTSTLLGTVSRSMEYYDTAAKRSSFSINIGSSAFRAIVYHDRQQAAVINMSDPNIATKCTAQSAKEDDLKLGITIQESQTTLPSATFFFGKGDENIEDKGKETVDGVEMRKFYSCFYIASKDASAEMTWYFKQDGSSYTPMRIQARTRRNEIQLEETAIHQISRFSTEPPHWTSFTDPFIAPPGVYCNGLSSDNRQLNLPTRFSMRVEDKPQIALETNFFKEAYNLNLNLSSWEGYPRMTSGDQLIFGLGKLQYVFDAKRSLAYINNLDLGNCTYRKVNPGDVGDSFTSTFRRIRNPREIFDLDAEYVQYKGTGNTRDYKSDIFIALKSLMNDGKTYTTSIEWHFTNRSFYDVASKKMMEYSFPVRCLVTSENMYYNTLMEIYDFEVDKLRFQQHDITKCFESNAKKHFKIFYPLSSAAIDFVKHRPNDFISIAMLELPSELGVGPLRVLDPDLSFDDSNAILEVTITDKPDFLSDTEDAPLNSLDSRMQEIIDKKTLIAIFTDDQSNIITTTANRAVALSTRGDSPGGGYSAGDMAGIAIGLLLAGLVAGLIAAFIYWR